MGEGRGAWEADEVFVGFETEEDEWGRAVLLDNG